jgi:hypothetical protein
VAADGEPVDMPERVEMSVTDSILAILHGRTWGMTYDQIVADPAWAAIRDGKRAEQDYEYGVPTTRTLDVTIIRMLADQEIERIMTAPPTYRLRRSSHQRARALAQTLTDHIN